MSLATRQSHHSARTPTTGYDVSLYRRLRERRTKRACTCDVKDTEKLTSRTRALKELVMGVLRKGERLGLMSTRDCESIRADKGEPNVCDLII